MPKPSSVKGTPSARPDVLLPAGYRDAEWVAEGSFGKVLKARAPGGARRCAFKVVRVERGGLEGLKEFRAFQLVRKIAPHPNLMGYEGVWLGTANGDLLDNADELDDGDLERLGVTHLLIQMPLADMSLSDRLKERRAAGPWPAGADWAAEVLGYVRDAAAGLDYLHKPIHDLGGGALARVIHRDIKPGNLLLVGPVVQVADYGIARADVVGRKSTESVSLTYPYAPAELLNNRPVPASDQYSLALTYYELRTGGLPFEGAAMFAQVEAGGAFDFAQLPAEQEVLRRATHQDSKRRFPSCVAFAAALEQAAGVDPAGPLPAAGPAAPQRKPGTDPGDRSKTFNVPPGDSGGVQAPPPRPVHVTPGPALTLIHTPTPDHLRLDRAGDGPLADDLDVDGTVDLRELAGPPSGRHGAGPPADPATILAATWTRPQPGRRSWAVPVVVGVAVLAGVAAAGWVVLNRGPGQQTAEADNPASAGDPPPPAPTDPVRPPNNPGEHGGPPKEDPPIEVVGGGKPGPTDQPPTPGPTVPPRPNYQALLGQARDHFHGARPGEGLSKLTPILDPSGSPDQPTRAAADALRKAWESVGPTPARPADLVAACAARADGLRALADSTEDRGDLGRYFDAHVFPDLVRDFNPADAKAADKVRLAAAEGVKASPSAWLAALEAECRLLAGAAGPKSPAPVAPSVGGPAELTKYQAFVTAGATLAGAEPRAKAGKPAAGLVTAAGDAGAFLASPARRRLVGRLLLDAAKGQVDDKAALQAPYTDPKAAAECLKGAEQYLADDPEVWARQLLAAGQQKAPPGRGDPPGKHTPADAAAKLDRGERAGFWLAYARTRDPKARGGDFVLGYDRFVREFVPAPAADPDAAMARSEAARRACQYLPADEALRALRPADGGDYGRKVLGPLALAVMARPELANPRVRSDDEPVVAAAGLAARAARLADDDDLRALDGVLGIEAALDRDAPPPAPEEPALPADPSPIRLAHRGQARLLKADLAADPEEKGRLYAGAAADLTRAGGLDPGAAGLDETHPVRALALRGATRAHIQLATLLRDRPGDGGVRGRLDAAGRAAAALREAVGDVPRALDLEGCVAEDRAWLGRDAGYTPAERQGYYDAAVEAFKRATDGTGADLSRIQARLHLGRARFRRAVDFPKDPRRESWEADAAADFARVAAEAARPEDRAEALLRLAMLDLSRAGLARRPGAHEVLPDDLLDAGPGLKADRLAEAADRLRKLRDEPAVAARATRLVGLEWLGCLRAYQAADHPETLAAFRELAADKPTAAAYYRSRYLSRRVVQADGRAAELDARWAEFAAGLAAFTPGRDRDFLAPFYRCHGVPAGLAVRGLSGRAGAHAEKAIAALAGCDALPAAERAARLDEVGRGLVDQARKAGDQEADHVPPAARAFVAAERLRPAAPDDPAKAAAFRKYAADALTNRAAKALQTGPEAAADDLLLIDALYAQAGRLDPKKYGTARPDYWKAWAVHDRLAAAVKAVEPKDPDRAAGWQRWLNENPAEKKSTEKK
ncbi:MAG: protein kinase [Gemmataceae bacterium]|nr:protein kinase [Gemmataceae bacterium]